MASRQRGDYISFNGLGPLQNALRCQTPQGMRNNDWLESGTAEGLGVDQRRVQERSGAYDHCGNAAVLQAHSIVQTARGARPSIGDGRHHEVAPIGQGVDNVISGGPGINKLVQDHRVPHLKPFVQRLFDHS